MQRLREEVRQLKQSVELATNTTPENLVERIFTYATRPLSEFNKYEVLEMLEILHNKATVGNHDKKKYYRLVYQTVREKVDSSKDHFKDLVMRLLGDKDHERVLDIVCKVERYVRYVSNDSTLSMFLLLKQYRSSMTFVRPTQCLSINSITLLIMCLSSSFSNGRPL